MRTHLLFFLMLCMIAGGSMLHAQEIKKATGGIGKYKENIWWLDFEGISLSQSSTVTQVYEIDGLYNLHIEISNISFSGELIDGLPLSEQRLVGYNSGNYGGDGLVMLYNIGVPNDGESHIDRAQNMLFNALAHKYGGNFEGSPFEAQANFTVKAYATLIGSDDPIDVGLVFADAETDEPDPTWPYEEYSQGTTNGTPWQVFEVALLDTTGYQHLVISNNGLTARTICGFYRDEFFPGNSILMYTRKINTTESQPLSVDIELKGSGKSATAIGFLLTSTDKGDAPEVYGDARNIFFSTVVGGTQPADGTYMIRHIDEDDTTPILTVGELGYDNVPRLGDVAGDPDEFVSAVGPNADMDDFDGVDDEDGLVTLPTITTRSSVLNLDFYAVNRAGYNAYLNVWADLDGNNAFDDDEFQSDVVSEPSTRSFSWTDVSPGAGELYIRARIQSNVPGTPQGAADIKMGGETEDYVIRVTTFISGNVFHDVNGLQDNPIGIVDGEAIQTIDGLQLYISLLDDSGNLIAQVPVNSDGSYEIGDVYIGNYQLVLTTEEDGTTAMLGGNWGNTGEHVGATAGTDGNPNGIILIDIIKGSGEVIEANFGIQQGPDSDNVVAVIDQPTQNDELIIGQGQLPPLSGTDSEDGDYLMGTGVSADPIGIVITSLPVNGQLLYNGVPVELNDVISDLDLGLLTILLDGKGYTSTSFEYAYIDQAGFVDQTPATYLIQWDAPLPIHWLSFQAVKDGAQVRLYWETAQESDNKGFFIERSNNLVNWETLGLIEPTAKFNPTKSNYQFTDNKPVKGVNYYRIRQQDYSGTYAFSEVRQVTFDNHNVLHLYPNPAIDVVYIQGVSIGDQLMVVDMLGRRLQNKVVTNIFDTIDVSDWPAGTYNLLMIQGNGNTRSGQFIKSE